ncbi:MAG: hypothetical protein HYZ58_08915 [Acidobacteria bacterium]|nr:hypothetical protein [Acidobacteriota bacterium]MBI3263260.1 hypothetical protein [Acidobacteriota bacterium]
MSVASALVALFLGVALVPPDEARPLVEQRFELRQRADAIATVVARCTGCSWDTPGKEAAVLVLSVDGAYSQHLMLVRGNTPAEYPVLLGILGAGPHQLGITLDTSWTPAGVGTVVDEVRITQPLADQALAVSHAPMLFARPNTIRRFTDVPVIMWYETERLPQGTRVRYSVLFTNEDGGTPTDRLMATWGRTTDIELVYEVDLDDRGAIRRDTIQAPNHVFRPFAGRYEAQHPLLWVATDNNMVSDAAPDPRRGERSAPEGRSSRGKPPRAPTPVRLAPAPFLVDLTDRSREAVMDAQPWTYRVGAGEVAREGKVTADASPGSGRIPDPRRFAYVEACGTLTDAALAFAIETRDGSGHTRWIASDGALPAFRIARNGCFRGAVALPSDVGRSQIAALRVIISAKPGATGPPEARLTRVNRVFFLGDDFMPGTNLAVWNGDVQLRPRAPFELAIRAP